MDRIKGTTDWRELIAMAEVDAIDVCLPTPAHVEIVTAALATGKHVICEKPMARTSADARRIADAAAAGAGGLHAGDVHAVLAGVGVAEGGGGGRAATAASAPPVSAASARCRPGGSATASSRAARCSTCTSTTPTSSTTCSAGPGRFTARALVGGSGEIDHVVTQYRFAGADAPAAVSAEGSWAAAEGFGFRMQYTVQFERATADYDVARKDGALALHADGKATPVETPREDGYTGELRYFTDCVRAGRRPERVTADDAVASIEIAEAEGRSIETGEAVTL
jgi:predicted dehydrogenase